MHRFQICLRSVRAKVSIFVGLAAPAGASAHSFVQSYTLPMPFSLYATGAALALVLSFLAAALFIKKPRLQAAAAPVSGHAASKSPVAVHMAGGRYLAVLLLVLCIVSGFIGSTDAFRNINMTLFWIVLFLVAPYAVVLFGDFYAAVNPWAGLVAGIERVTGRAFAGQTAFPSWLGHFPGLVLYMAIIVVELFGHQRPLGLSIALAAYTAIMVMGAWVFGKDIWIARAEVFGIICRLLGQISLRRRLGSAGDRQPADLGLMLFVLFMLSSTAFDGFHSTVQWVNGYWEMLYPGISWVDPLWSSVGGTRYAASTTLYRAWNWVGLLTSPFLYFAVFAVFIRLSAIAGGSTLSTHELMAKFISSLLPIALVYHLSHYFTLVLMQGPKVIQLVSDPLGFGWNLFGTANWKIEPLILEVSTIWHTQVALIVAGHVASVAIAHLEALRTFDNPRQATLSQLPMLALMVLFTASGLWILSLPISTS